MARVQQKAECTLTLSVSIPGPHKVIFVPSKEKKRRREAMLKIIRSYLLSLATSLTEHSDSAGETEGDLGEERNIPFN